jgi:uncharacterized protein (TIGR02246 family)
MPDRRQGFYTMTASDRCTVVRLKSTWLALAIAMLTCAPAYADVTSETPVLESLQRLAQAWNASNADAWASEYWPEGELINIRGDILSGPSQVREQTAKILAGPFKGSHFAFIVRNIRYIGNNVAIADTDILVTGFPGLPLGISTPNPGELRTRMKHVYERRHRIWRVIASQNTLVTSDPSTR